MAYADLGSKDAAKALQQEIMRDGHPAKLTALGEAREIPGVGGGPYHDTYRVSTTLNRRKLADYIRRGGHDAFVVTVV